MRSYLTEKTIFFATAAVVTIPVTVLLCHIRTMRKRRISFGTVLLSAFFVTFCWFGFATRGDIYTVSFWDGSRAKAPDRELVLKFIAFMIITCDLPALAVVHLYQREAKKDDHAA